MCIYIYIKTYTYNEREWDTGQSAGDPTITGNDESFVGNPGLTSPGFWNNEENFDEGHTYIYIINKKVIALPKWGCYQHRSRGRMFQLTQLDNQDHKVGNQWILKKLPVQSFKTPTFLKMSQLLFQHSTTLLTWRMKLRWQRCNYRNLKNPMDSTSLNPLNCQWITNGQIAASYIDDLWEWSSSTHWKS